MGDDGETGRTGDQSEATVLYPAARRGLVLVPFAIGRACAPLLLVLVLTAADPPITPPDLAFLFAVFVALPAGLAAALRAAGRGSWQLDDSLLVVRRRGETLEIPLTALAAATPWRLPCPAPGLTLRSRAGRRIRIEDGEARLLDALDPAIAPVTAVTAVYARGRRARPRRRWYHLAGKFVVFALLPTAPLFNVHQHIAYGGTFGEYYLLGLRSYLTTFAAYWSSVAILLVAFAAVWRWLVEAACLSAAALAPSRAAAVRVWSERAATFLYYGGVPVALALRFWPW